MQSTFGYELEEECPIHRLVFGASYLSKEREHILSLSPGVPVSSSVSS